MSSVKITVNEAILKLQEKNKKPKKMYNKGELTELVFAMMNDKDFLTKQAELKSGEIVIKDRKLGEEFATALVDVLKGVGLKQAEAEELVKNYKLPKSLASSVVDIVHAADYMYMDKIGKGIKFIGDSKDTVQTLFFGKANTRTHKIPATSLNKSATPSEYSAVKVDEHNRLQLKTTVSKNLKTWLK